MNYNDEEFYNEPSEFEQQIDEFKESLLKSVKTDFVTEMDKLRTENAELQEIKKNFDLIKRDYSNKERQLENERRDLESKIRRERLSVLMKDFEVLMFRVDYKNVMPPKCDKCNEQRRVPYITPLGKHTEEDCTCKIANREYFPAEYVISSFRINSDNKEMLIWYKMNPDRDYDHGSYDSGDLAKTIWVEGMAYEKNHYKVYFKTREDCQKYCDWLTEGLQSD